VIAEQRHLTSASGKLNRTQSAISVQLRKLEETLDVTLFTRTPQGMVLTPQGEKLVPVAQAALDNLITVQQLFTDPLTGVIRVGIPDDYDDFMLEKVLAQFAGQNPSVEVIATSGCTSGFAKMIAVDKLDVAVVSGPHDGGGQFLSIEDIVWAVAEQTRIDLGCPIPLIVLDRGCWWQDLVTDALDMTNIAYRVVFKSGSFSSLKAAIRAGLGVGILPKHCVTRTLRTLGPSDGFPMLPSAHRSILINPKCESILTAAMVGALTGSKPSGVDL